MIYENKPSKWHKFTVCLWFKLLCVSKKVFVDMVDFYERISNSVYLLQIKPDERVLITERGLLIRWLQHSDAGSYFCTSQEHSFTRTLLHLSLHVLDRGQIQAHQPATRESSENPSMTEPRQLYKDYLRMLSGPVRSLDEYCETLWLKEKKQKQKGKWKHVQELRKSRNRRHHQRHQWGLESTVRLDGSQCSWSLWMWIK